MVSQLCWRAVTELNTQSHLAKGLLPVLGFLLHLSFYKITSAEAKISTNDLYAGLPPRMSQREMGITFAD